MKKIIICRLFEVCIHTYLKNERYHLKIIGINKADF